MILKKCNCSYCTNLVEYGINYCKEHEPKKKRNYRKYNEGLNNKDRYKEYRKYRTDIQEQDFYNSDTWKAIRRKVIADCLGMDLIEYYLFNRIVQGEIVHHIIEIKSDWNKRFDINNLFFLTKENHNKVHSKMNISNQMQYEVIKMLKDFKIRFKEEFKL